MLLSTRGRKRGKNKHCFATLVKEDQIQVNSMSREQQELVEHPDEGDRD